MHAALIQAVTSVVRPTASYRAIELGAEPQWLGALSAGFAVLPLFAAVLVGRMTDRRGEGPVIVAGAGTVVVAVTLFATVGGGLPVLVAFSALLGLGHLLIMVSEQSLVPELAGGRSRDAAFGHYTFAVSAGQAIGPAILAGLGGSSVRPDTATLFASGTAMAVLMSVIAVRLRRSSARRIPRPRARAGAVLRVPGLPAAVVASLVVVSAVDIVAVYLPALGVERGLGAGVVGLLLLLRAVASMASRFFLAALVGRLGRARMLVGGSVVAGSALVALALPLPGALVAVAVGVAGLGLGVGQPLTLTWVTLLAPAGQRATALSMRLTGNRLGQTLVPTAIGLTAGGFGAGGVLAATGTLLAGATALAARRVTRAGAADGDGL